MIPAGAAIPLGDGLALRAVRDEADKVRYADFNAVYNNPQEGATAACLLQHHPGTTADDFWMVEDLSNGQIVSTTCLLPWVGCFEGIDLRVAQLEMVLTHPDYRGRGLVRAQMQHFETVTRACGYDLNIIWGIPYYYRQFGYAYSIESDTSEALPVWKVPSDLEETAPEVRLRPARSEDIPFLAQKYAEANASLDFYLKREPAYWRYLLEAAHHPFMLVEDGQSVEPLGYVSLSHTDGVRRILECSLSEPEAGLGLLRLLKTQSMEPLTFTLPETNHLRKAARCLGSQAVQGSQWLVRFPDVARFLVKIGPVLENRLADSTWRSLTRALLVNLFRQAYRLRFEAGKLNGVEALGFVDSSMGAKGGDLLIPPEAFVRLVTGFRGLEALADAWPDTYTRPEIRGLVEVLFPRLLSHLYTPYHIYLAA